MSGSAPLPHRLSRLIAGVLLGLSCAELHEDDGDPWLLQSAADARWKRHGQKTPVLDHALKGITTPEPVSDGRFLTLLISSPYHEEQRLKPILHTWGRRLGSDPIFVGSEAPFTSLDLPGHVRTVTTNETVAGRGLHDAGREGAPDMRLRVALLLAAARSFFGDPAPGGEKLQWALMADDDNYVRAAPVRAVLRHLNHSQPLMLGFSSNLMQMDAANTFALGELCAARHRAHGWQEVQVVEVRDDGTYLIDWGDDGEEADRVKTAGELAKQVDFCSGGRTIAFSRALLESWDETWTQKCLTHPKLRDIKRTLGDVFISRCAHEMLGVSCTDPTVGGRWLTAGAVFHHVREPGTFNSLDQHFSDAEDSAWAEGFAKSHAAAAKASEEL